MKKSYKGFILWLIVFGVIIAVLCHMPFQDDALMIRLIFNSCSIFVTVLMYIVYKTDKIYWLNIVSSEDIARSDYQRQKIYTKKLFKRFAKFAAGYLVLSLLLHIIGISMLVDVIVFMIGFIAITFSSTTIKL